MIKLVLSFALIANFWSCAKYQASVDSRSIGAKGYVDVAGSAGGKVIYTVHYK
jgi:hypothetical protein